MYSLPIAWPVVAEWVDPDSLVEWFEDPSVSEDLKRSQLTTYAAIIGQPHLAEGEMTTKGLFDNLHEYLEFWEGNLPTGQPTVAVINNQQKSRHQKGTEYNYLKLLKRSVTSLTKRVVNIIIVAILFAALVYYRDVFRQTSASNADCIATSATSSVESWASWLGPSPGSKYSQEILINFFEKMQADFSCYTHKFSPATQTSHASFAKWALTFGATIVCLDIILLFMVFLFSFILILSFLSSKRKAIERTA